MLLHIEFANGTDTWEVPENASICITAGLGVDSVEVFFDNQLIHTVLGALSIWVYSPQEMYLIKKGNKMPEKKCPKCNKPMMPGHKCK